MSEGRWHVSIDLSGSAIAVAACDAGGEPFLVPSTLGQPTTPAIVRLDARGLVSVGGRAQRMLDADPQNTRDDVIRSLGTDTSVLFAASRRRLRPPEIAAEVLKQLRRDVEARLGLLPTRAVLVTPQGEPRLRGPICEAAWLAGFDTIELVERPVATALGLGWSDDNQGEVWLCLGMGRRALSASLLESRDGFLTITRGEVASFLGGDDFTRLIVEEAHRASGARFTWEKLDPADQRRLMRAAEDAKHDLNSAQLAHVHAPFLRTAQGALDLDVPLSRERFARLAEPLLDRALASCRALLASEGLVFGQLAQVFLVGGGTRMIALQEYLKGQLGVLPLSTSELSGVAAKGGALHAARWELCATTERLERIKLAFPSTASRISVDVLGWVSAPGGDQAVVRIEREDGWRTDDVPLVLPQAFAESVELAPHRPNNFAAVPTTPGGMELPGRRTFTIAHGAPLSSPRVPITLGVALSSGRTRTYLARGAPLPGRRFHAHRATTRVRAGRDEDVLTVPVVEGALGRSYLSRLFASVEVRGAELSFDLSQGDPVEITFALGESGELTVQIEVGVGRQRFERRLFLMGPGMTADAVRSLTQATRPRVEALVQRQEQQTWAPGTVALLEEARVLQGALEAEPDEARAWIVLYRLYGLIELLEGRARLEEVTFEAITVSGWAARWVAHFGSNEEAARFARLTEAIERARRSEQPFALIDHCAEARALGAAAYSRHPDATRWDFEMAIADVGPEPPEPLVSLIAAGRRAARALDAAALRGITAKLQEHAASEPRMRELAFSSGIC